MTTVAAWAQDPDFAPLNLTFAQKKMGQVHLITQVEFGSGDTMVRFVYDRLPANAERAAMERIQRDNAIYTRIGKGAWLRSYNGPREPISDALSVQMDSYVAIVNSPFVVPENRDLNQGFTAWKWIGQQQDSQNTKVFYYTYERSRQHPTPNSNYWKFTFMKTEADKDGNLLLVSATGKLLYGKDEVPVAILYGYLPVLPEQTAPQK